MCSIKPAVCKPYIAVPAFFAFEIGGGDTYQAKLSDFVVVTSSSQAPLVFYKRLP